MSKTNILWGGSIVTGAIIAPLVIGIIAAMIFANRTDINNLAASQQSHVRAVNGSLHEIENTLNSVSINQKRLMDEVGVKYIHPEPIHKWEDGK